MTTALTIETDTVRQFLCTLVQVERPQAELPDFDTVMDEVRRLGIGPGRAVLVALPHGGQFLTVLLALLARGAVPILLPPSAPPSRIERMAQALGADVLVAPRIQADLAGGEPSHTIARTIQLTFLRDLVTDSYLPGEIILLTSGTSGVFSGCLHRVDSLLRNAARHVRSIGQTSADRVLVNLPMHYSYAFVAQVLGTLVSGGTAVIAGPPFTPAHYERTLQDHQVTVSSLTPTLVESWRRVGRKLPAPLRALTVGGGGLDASSVANVLEHNPNLELYLTYGLTEAGPRVSTLAAHLEPPRRYSSVGLPLPGVRVRLRTDRPDDHVGELIVETDTGMLRRVGRRDESACPVGDGRTSISTGDIFAMDDDGYLFFRSRRPTYVISRGEKVSLRSVCEIAETLPGIRGAEAWTHESASGDVVFTLDVYCADDSIDEREVRRRLAKVLLRSEQPAHLLIHPAAQLGWRKSVAK
ncbi:class I adenylate-forming enzyme family protein [Streptomyces sp. W16]|uniref:class I adenylate-forming enzyme family protein n=1 Tax=Streptomyces sp. W16 TaxID=3076631 RepID=UPI00295AF98D|nr:class I adenylate-forming enzyme family protein [Streptomyces sp. W16]MDV9168539.1 class I adenylate-forming enzyme family protein [Streptomyces sp. W16]